MPYIYVGNVRFTHLIPVGGLRWSRSCHSQKLDGSRSITKYIRNLLSHCLLHLGFQILKTE